MRIATLNFWGAHEPFSLRLAVAAAGLGALDLDVVMLQEVRDGDLPNTAAQLASRLGPEWRHAYAAAVRGAPGTFGPGSAAGEEGLAILSRHPILEQSDRELPEARPNDRRILLSAAIDFGGTRARFHVTHLHWRPADGLAREKQVAAVDEMARAQPADVHVVGGDFNATPDSDEIRFLRGRTTLAGRRTYWQDAFARTHPDERGATWSKRNPHIAELGWLEPERRIDYLFVAGKGRVRDARVILDEPTDGVFASDHFGVMAEIDI